MRKIWMVTALAGGACQESTLKDISDVDEQQVALLETDPDALLFGGVDFDESPTEIVTLSSVGNVPVTLLGATISGDGAFTMTWDPGGMVLDPGESVEVPISYVPASPDDGAELIIQSNASESKLSVPLSGQMLTPAIVVSPSPALFETEDGQPVSVDLLIENTGTATLDLTQQFIRDDSGHFAVIETPIPTEVAAGASAVVTVEYTPGVDFFDDTAELWIDSNAPSSPTLVPLLGTQPPPCYSLAEAWDRGMMDLHSYEGIDITVKNLTADEDICIDRWYIFMGVETQDAMGGDPFYDPTLEYPLGSLVVGPGESLSLHYGAPKQPAWWCIEQSQAIEPTIDFLFIGARAPAPLVERALGPYKAPQTQVWGYQQNNPAVIVGRYHHYAELIRASTSGRAMEADFTVLNIGQKDVVATVRETIPAGFFARGFSQEPTRSETHADGSVTHTFEVPLDARRPDENYYEHTDYDEVTVTYELVLDDPEYCVGRIYTPVPLAEWADSEGAPQVSVGSPITLHCL